jgi:hypothetical protein
MAIGLASFPPLCAHPQAQGGGLRTRNVILITFDGVRIQEMFGGMDPVVSEKEKHSGIYDLERARSRFWRETPEQRRAALMPFFWGTLAPQGIVLGNREKGGRVRVTNPLLFSAPGYVELLTGQPHAEVTSNDLIRYPFRTALEHVQSALRLSQTQVATIGSWEGFGLLSASREKVLFTNTGYERVPEPLSTPRMRYLGDLQMKMMALWEEGRNDVITFELAREYLSRHRPRLLYLAPDETDDWSHARRYDRLLDCLRIYDDHLRELWTLLESLDSYRGRTTLIITTDHGRGVRPSDWVEHGEGIAGAEDIWIAVIGPDTPDRGDAAPHPEYHQADVAATVVEFFGLDYRKFNPQAGPPIALALGRPEPPLRDPPAPGAAD